MGNAAGKESDSPQSRSPASPSSASFAAPAHEGLSRHGRSNSSRHESSFLGIGSSSSSAGLGGGAGAHDARKETRQEREARKLAKERASRLKERERSVKEEHVDGGYLVTLGTYTGLEDFSKATVRQLMIERRLAPFWRGLNDHSDSWTEHQLVAAAQGKPIPAPDEIPEDENLTPPPASSSISTSAPTRTQALPVPKISGGSNDSGAPSGSHPAAAFTGLSPSSIASSSSPLFRGRAKTLASLASSSRTQTPVEITPQEIQLPREPFLNGMRIEAHLYKDVLECPICFLYYPPYLNKTRCCDQPICSECFVQIKRPDPHPPEHLDPNTPVPDAPPRPEEENLLVSEPATCPFCVQAEFGVSYQPPVFKRGLAYAHSGTPMLRTSSAMSSGSEASAPIAPTLGTQSSTPARRRAESLSANSPSVITTDKVRPDWAKKLSDARSQQARRAAAATALHTAAYLVNNNQTSGASPFSRRRRAETTGSTSASNQNNPDLEQLMAVLETRRPHGQPGHPHSQLFPTRGSSQRATSAQDLEEIMLMEAIRLSIAAEEERQKREEKNAAKQAKLDDKQRAKDDKKAAKRPALSPSSSANNSSAMLSGAARDNSDPTASIAEDGAAGGGLDGTKGKQRTRPADTSDATPASEAASAAAAMRTLPSLTPLAEPTSTLNADTSAAAQEPAPDASTQKLEQTFNFRSLAEMIGDGGGEGGEGDQSAAATTSGTTATASHEREEGRHPPA